MNWIGRAEYCLGLMRPKFEKEDEAWEVRGYCGPEIVPQPKDLWKNIPWRGYSRPRALSTSWLILCFYAFLVFVDVVYVLIMIMYPVVPV